jgi:hypothetical protein
MRCKLLFIVIGLLLVPILCFLCWQAGGTLGPLFLDRPVHDVDGKLTPVSISNDLTNTALNSYSVSLVIVPKPNFLPASGFLTLVGIPKPDNSSSGLFPDVRLELTGVVLRKGGSQSMVKPVRIPSSTVIAREPFIIFLDFRTLRPDSVEFHAPTLRPEKL